MFFETSTNMTRVIFDSIHKTIELEDYLWRIVDTDYFQRLRHLKQTGINSYVYASATHSRFEHSIGVCHLAGVFIKKLHYKHPNIISKHDIIYIQIAALLHDVGHGPFSHLFERAMTRLNKKFDHELQSVTISKLILTSVLPICKFDFTLDLNLVAAIITGDTEHPYIKSKPFLNDIVHNSSSGLDVDKFDYLLRDSYQSGMSVTFDVDRIFKMAVLASKIPNSLDPKDYVLAYPEKEKYHLLEVFTSRHRMHRLVYTHPVSRAIEFMVIDLFQLADEYFNFSELIQTDYLRLTDDILLEIGRSSNSKLKEARNISQRIGKRQIYKKVMQKILPEKVYKSLLLQHNKDKYFMLKYADDIEFPKDNVIVDLFKVNFGKGTQNPIQWINYVDRDHNLIPLESFRMEDVTGTGPVAFEEYMLRIYCKNEEYLPKVLDIVEKYWNLELSNSCRGPFVNYTPKKNHDHEADKLLSNDLSLSPTPAGNHKKRRFGE
eukprot:NODE_150_length_17275_cov_0.559618.p3 type:complete len:490 gc:universal NODE_150_length_17275_cov_0.559618:13570-15039(+)